MVSRPSGLDELREATRTGAFQDGLLQTSATSATLQLCKGNVTLGRDNDLKDKPQELEEALGQFTKKQKSTVVQWSLALVEWISPSLLKKSWLIFFATQTQNLFMMSVLMSLSL